MTSVSLQLPSVCHSAVGKNTHIEEQRFESVCADFDSVGTSLHMKALKDTVEILDAPGVVTIDEDGRATWADFQPEGAVIVVPDGVVPRIVVSPWIVQAAIVPAAIVPAESETTVSPRVVTDGSIDYRGASDVARARRCSARHSSTTGAASAAAVARPSSVGSRTGASACGAGTGGTASSSRSWIGRGRGRRAAPASAVSGSRWRPSARRGGCSALRRRARPLASSAGTSTRHRALSCHALRCDECQHRHDRRRPPGPLQQSVCHVSCPIASPSRLSNLTARRAGQELA